MKNEILEEKKHFLKKCRKFRFFVKQQRGDQRKFFKNGRFFRQTFQGKKNKKYKSYDSLISMDRKLNYCRVVLCETPHEKQAIRRQIAISVVSKMAIFRKTAKGGPMEIFQKWPIF